MRSRRIRNSNCQLSIVNCQLSIEKSVLRMEDGISPSVSFADSSLIRGSRGSLEVGRGGPGALPFWGKNYSTIMDILFLVTSRTPVPRTRIMPRVMNRKVPSAPVSGSMVPVLLTT